MLTFYLISCEGDTLVWGAWCRGQRLSVNPLRRWLWESLRRCFWESLRRWLWESLRFMIMRIFEKMIMRIFEKMIMRIFEKMIMRMTMISTTKLCWYHEDEWWLPGVRRWWMSKDNDDNDDDLKCKWWQLWYLPWVWRGRVSKDPRVPRKSNLHLQRLKKNVN